MCTKISNLLLLFHSEIHTRKLPCLHTSSLTWSSAVNLWRQDRGCRLSSHGNNFLCTCCPLFSLLWTFIYLNSTSCRHRTMLHIFLLWRLRGNFLLQDLIHITGLLFVAWTSSQWRRKARRSSSGSGCASSASCCTRSGTMCKPWSSSRELKAHFWG